MDATILFFLLGCIFSPVTSRHWLTVDETRPYPRFLTIEEMRLMFSKFRLEHLPDNSKYT
ncbi:hypothetical protein BIFDEN_01464 [Bifidobacterium dentium ATCC 27678]|nr:hypothetical protein BIFDEN_01464 [Bifidobacterium dentium ATCC 27678]